MNDLERFGIAVEKLKKELIKVYVEFPVVKFYLWILLKIIKFCEKIKEMFDK